MPASVPVAYALGLVPLLWIAAHHERRREWWWLAAALGVSFLADSIALVAYLLERPVAPLVSAIYPVGQAALIGAVFLPRSEARAFLAVLVAVGLASLLLPAAILLDTTAWLGVALIAWRESVGLIRPALLTIFGLGWLAWMLYDLLAATETWTLYQACRAVGTVLFCIANRRPALRAVYG